MYLANARVEAIKRLLRELDVILPKILKSLDEVLPEIIKNLGRMWIETKNEEKSFYFVVGICICFSIVIGVGIWRNKKSKIG
jgi:hypothetical protein